MNPGALASGFFCFWRTQERFERFGLSLEKAISKVKESEERPIVELLRLAGPTVAQMASYTVMQFLDTWMLSHVGNHLIAPTAAANSGILAFAVISLGMGVLWVVNTLVSQSYGRKDTRACGQFLWQGIWFSIIFAILIWPFLPLVPRVFAALGHQPSLANEESLYLQNVLSASALKLIRTSFAQFLLAIDRAAWVMIATVIGISANAVSAWALIFGHLGFGSHGVVGSAWAQNFGVAIETLMMIVFTLLPTVRRRFNVRDWKLRWREMKTLLAIGMPSGLQVVADVLAWGAFINLVMARYGTEGMAANNFVFRYMAVSFMPAFGISTAVTALVGRYIGRQRPDIAMSRAHLGFRVALVYMLGCGLLFFIFRRHLIELFSDDPKVIAIGATMLIFAAIYQLFDAMYIVYYGALRGAGDTFVPAVATAVLCWSITVGGGYAVARYLPQFGPAGPWTLATTYGAILGLFISLRFARGGWRRIHLDTRADADRLRVPGPQTEPAGVSTAS
jgi:MATE family multidrug resistance protein